MVKKKLIITSELDKDVFDVFLILIAAGLGALGIEDIISLKCIGLIKLGIAFLIILFVSQYIRKKSDRRK